MTRTGRHHVLGQALGGLAYGVPLCGLVILCVWGATVIWRAWSDTRTAASPPDRRGVAPDAALEQGRPGAGTPAAALRGGEPSRVRGAAPFPGRDASAAPPATSEGKNSAFFRAIVTAYDQSAVSCGPWAAVPIAARRTACGASLLARLTNWEPFVAGPPELPAGTLIRIPGYAGGRPVPVLDRGGAFRAARPVLRLDVFIPDVGACRHWGRREVRVEILNWPEVKEAITAESAGIAEESKP